MNSILKLDNPDKRAFYTRLVCINKTKNPYPEISDTRPLAVTTIVQKIIEHMLLNRLLDETDSSMAKTQFEFRQGCETTMHLVRLMDRIYTL